MTEPDGARPLRWGILGAAKIARERVVPAAQRSSRHRFVAVGSRDLATARGFAERFGLPRAYGDYESVLRDRDVDAVYVPLPNHMHVEWTLRAVEAGKHVLCEKPLALSASDVRRIAQAAREAGVRVMEGFMVLAHPRWKAVRNLVRGGIIGDLDTVHVVFSNPSLDPGNIRNRVETAGGALTDKGCYGLALARYLFGEEPASVSAAMDIDLAFGIDRATSGVLRFARGLATFTCSSQGVPHQHLTATGTRGRIDVPVAMTPSDDIKTVIRVDPGRDPLGSGAFEMEFERCNHYRLLFDGFADAVATGSEMPVPIAFSEGNARTLEQVIACAGVPAMCAPAVSEPVR